MGKDKTDVFLTHDWGKDQQGRNNHNRVAAINTALKARGYKTWFDSDRMTGDIMSQMADGIKNTKVVLVFVTKRYIDKVGGDNEGDNCKLEFQYALRVKTKKLMVAVVMEDSVKRADQWDGPVGIGLGGELGIRLNFDFTNTERFEAEISNLCLEIDNRLRLVGKDATPTPPVPVVHTPAPAVPTPAPVIPTPAPVVPIGAPAGPADLTLYALQQGAGDNIRIKLICATTGFHIYPYGKTNLRVVTNKTFPFIVKPKRQNGNAGFAITTGMEKGKTETGLQRSLIIDDSYDPALTVTSFNDEEENFWQFIPVEGDEKAFKIIHFNSGRALAVSGEYLVSEKNDCEAQTFWRFEPGRPINRAREIKVFSKIFDKDFRKVETDFFLTTKEGGGLDYRHNRVSYNFKSGAKKKLPWKLLPSKTTESGVVVTTPDGLYLAVHEGVAVLDEEEEEDGVWSVVPVGVWRDEVECILRKVTGEMAGAKLAVDQNGKFLVLTEKRDSKQHIDTWILSC